MIENVYFLHNCIYRGTNVPMTICILISYMYVLPASKKCRALWPIKFIKGTRPGLKRPAQVTVQQMQKKDLNMKRRKDRNGFSTQNGAKVVHAGVSKFFFIIGGT